MTNKQLDEMEKDGVYEELSFALYHHDRELSKELEKEAIDELRENADDE